jgi:site-specific DNA recombinase
MDYHVDESLRIISDDLWDRAQRRVRPANTDKRLKAGGKPKYLLSGLLRCDVCDAHYTITNATSYGCSGYHDGRACGNAILVRRDRVEHILLGPIRDDLLKPDRVARMAKEMQDYLSDRLQATQVRATEAPRELEELEARIARLRDRLKRGDPDIPDDELQAAIDRAEEKHRELQEQLRAYLPAKAFVFMSRAAELYRPPSHPRPRWQSTSRAKSARLLTRVVRRKNPAGASAGWWSHGPLESERWRALKGPRDIYGSGGRMLSVPSVPRSARVK